MLQQLKKIALSQSFLRKIIFYTRKLWLQQKKGIKIGPNSSIGFSTTLEGKNRFVGYNNIFGSIIGFGTYIGPKSNFNKTKMGRYCSIGQNVNCIFGKHPTSNFVSTHPAFFSPNHSIGFSYVSENKFKEHSVAVDDEKKYAIAIGHDVWLGDNVSLMEGVNIGNGAIVAANALVTKNIEPYTIVGGVPAKEIKKRFTNEEINFLNNLKWWDKPEAWVIEYAPYFEDIKKLKAKLEHE